MSVSAKPVIVYNPDGSLGHIDASTFGTLTSLKAATSAFVAGLAISLLSFVDDLFSRREHRARDDLITSLILFSAYLSVSSAMIYGISAVGILWDMKMRAGWWNAGIASGAVTSSWTCQLTFEGVFHIWFDLIFIVAQIPLAVGLAILIWDVGTRAMKVTLLVVVVVTAVPWLYRLGYALKAFTSKRRTGPVLIAWENGN